MSPFICIKLKTGETLFAEIEQHHDQFITVNYPFQVKLIKVTGDSEGAVLSPWIPYVSDTIFDIPLNHVLYVGQLKETYIRFYGSSRMKEDISSIHRRGYERIEEGEIKSKVVKEIYAEVANLCEEYSVKFGLDLDEIKQEFTPDIEEENDSLKRVVH